MSQQKVYAVEIAGIKRELPLFEVKPGLKIAILNILGDVELNEAAAQALVDKVEASGLDYDVIVTAEAKSITLAYAMALKANKPYVILRKDYKSYMGNAIKTTTMSITTGREQTLFLDEKDIDLIKGKKVLVIDDVISTGSTLEAMHEILEEAGGDILGNAAVMTEGDPDAWQEIICLGTLPLFFE
jgi:adenine phosphoribosyltransferase